MSYWHYWNLFWRYSGPWDRALWIFSALWVAFVIAFGIWELT